MPAVEFSEAGGYDENTAASSRNTSNPSGSSFYYVFGRF